MASYYMRLRKSTRSCFKVFTSWFIKVATNTNFYNGLSEAICYFDIKPAFITMIQTSIQFEGHLNDDPHAHINNFLKICDTLKINGVRENVI